MTEQEVRQNTEEHIKQVRTLLTVVILLLKERASSHDRSKLEEPEFGVFVEYTPKLAASEYGSDEYKLFLKEMAPTLAHHYKVNRHHPEYNSDGVSGMNLVDLIEMLCDWKAASLGHKNGDLMRSIDINIGRFELSSQLVQILKNTAEMLK